MEEIKYKCKKCGKLFTGEQGGVMNWEGSYDECSDCSWKEYDNLYNRIKGQETRKAVTPELRKKIYLIYDGKCAICRRRMYNQTENIDLVNPDSYGCEIHHITPIKDGGDNDFYNLILLCPNHHYKADHELIEKTILRKTAERFFKKAIRKPMI